MKKVLLTILLIVLALAILCGLAIGFGWFDVFMTNTVGVAQKDADYNKFKNSKPHIESMVRELSDLRLEFIKTDDPIIKKAIAETVVSRCANFDIYDIEDVNLRDFLNDCRNGDID